MVALYYETQSNKNAPIQLFAELASVEATGDPTPLGEEDGVEAPYPDAARQIEVSEYPEIPHANRMGVYSDPEELYVGQRFESKEECMFAIKLLATLMPRIGQQQVNQMEAGHVFIESIKDAMVVNRQMARSMTVQVYSRHNETFRVTEIIGCRPSTPPRSYGVDLRNRRCDCRRFQTLHFPCAHVVVACAKVGLNVEQFIDEVYTIERTLRVWENEFPVLLDLSTWEVPPTTFELVPDKRLRRNLKGRPQSSRIHNEMDIREISDGNLCGVCRLAGHNRSKCPLRNYHVGQSSQSGRN
ncbi:uncharacterized protein LOC128041895 [Gossypium raimondii]|uniref:uncharacterized protein LOC128041895 n=1 Tax=Gossypium raimondii TaxID=29730 RepID=UPI00227B176A|nr:uncharacterized protein LOC128041895 [Gossypium raimondii]